MKTIEPRATPVDFYVGQRVRLRRTLLGMTQEALAEKLGISFQQIQKYEKGTNRVSASRLYAMGNALEVPVSYFFDGLEDGKHAEDPATSKQNLELLKSYNRIPVQSVRDQMRTIVKAAADAWSAQKAAAE
jgi:transcriptional regulator with XRE-family HTH domain